MKPFKLNRTATLIVEYIRRHPGKMKREIATALHMPRSTIDMYLGPLKVHGYIKADTDYPPHYVPSIGVVSDEDASTSAVVNAMRAMVLVGRPA